MLKKRLNINAKYIFLFLILFIIVSCKKSEKYINEYSLGESIKRSTKIVIERHKKLEIASGTTFPVEGKVCEVTDKNQMLHFERVFKNGKLLVTVVALILIILFPFIKIKKKNILHSIMLIQLNLKIK